MKDDSRKNSELNEENPGMEGVQNVSTFRRILPQILASTTKNLIGTNTGEFFGFMAILIPALTGLNKELNPDETLEITADQASWLPAITSIVCPIGCLLGGPLNDAVGRRKAMMFTNVLLVLIWVSVGFSQSYLMICASFVLFGLTLGLSEPPMVVYGVEICEPSMRGILISYGIIMFVCGPFIGMVLGAIFSWRQVAFISALFPIVSTFGFLLVPESPLWLISKDRFKEAQKSLQWLRGWVSPETVHKEFVELQNYSNTSNACAECTKQSIRCYHSKPTFSDKIKELKQRRTIRPLVLILGFQVISNFGISLVWEPYIVQVFNAFGSPIKPTYASVLGSCVGIFGCLFLMLTIRKFGRRKIYLTAIIISAMCCFGLSIYGFVLLPPGWTSFNVDSNQQPEDSDFITNLVGNYSYFALILILIIKFCGKAGVDFMFGMYVGEVFSLKSRSFMCGITGALHFVMSSIAAKTYYYIELWLSLPGATTFYGIISVIGFIVMYSIMPETEQRSLEDIERHYSDETKGFTDIHIHKQTETVEDKLYND